MLTQPSRVGMIETFMRIDIFATERWPSPYGLGWLKHAGSDLTIRHCPTQPSRVGMIETDIFAAISLGCSTQPSRAGMIETVHCRSTVPALRTQPPRAGMIETILCSLISASWPWPSSHRLGWLKFCYSNKSNSHLRPSPHGRDDWNTCRWYYATIPDATQPERVGMIESNEFQ